jgi:hypothetical protein
VITYCPTTGILTSLQIILCLDLFFLPLPDCDQRENRELAKNTIDILSQSDTSMIAMRGVKILRLLLRLDQNRGKESSSWDIRGLIQSFYEQETFTSHTDDRRPAENHPSMTEPRSPISTMQPPGFTARDSHTEEFYSDCLLPNSSFLVHDSLEDILLLAQNGGG